MHIVNTTHSATCPMIHERLWAANIIEEAFLVVRFHAVPQVQGYKQGIEVNCAADQSTKSRDGGCSYAVRQQRTTPCTKRTVARICTGLMR
jgi:hypothetical protein